MAGFLLSIQILYLHVSHSLSVNHLLEVITGLLKESESSVLYRGLPLCKFDNNQSIQVLCIHLGAVVLHCIVAHLFSVL